MILLSPTEKYEEQERLYIAVRDAEQRVVSDKLLKQLPFPLDSYPLNNEWKIRAESSRRFTGYLDKHYKGQKLNILDVGCGNGWMSHLLYKQGHTVTAVDLNTVELEQAERVFGTNENLQWVYADILKDGVVNHPFDLIILGASCQYFHNIRLLTDTLKRLLARGGQIHLLDSFFYTKTNVDNARQRTNDYYSKIGYPQMADYYHHHLSSDLKQLGYKKLFPTFFSGKGKPEWWMHKSS